MYVEFVSAGADIRLLSNPRSVAKLRNYAIDLTISAHASNASAQHASTTEARSGRCREGAEHVHPFLHQQTPILRR